MKLFYFLLASTLLFTACSKKTKTEIIDPAPEAAFTRTINYTQLNSIYTASYSGNNLLEAKALLDGNEILLGLFATPKVNGTTGDGVAFKISKSFLQGGLTGTYHLDAQTAPAVLSARYNHMWQKENGGFWSSIHETSMGLQIEGTLTIATYNADRKLLSGSFQMVIRDLISDPMRYDGPSTIDPMKLSTVTLTGTFTNLKLAPIE